MARQRVIGVVAVAGLVLALLPSQLDTAAAVTVTGSVDDGLWVSTLADRSNPVLLDGAALSGKVAIFVGPISQTKSVSFYLDGATRPVRVENVSPFDFAGTGANGVAKLYDLVALTPGTHRVKAVRSFTSGAPVSTESTFAVSRTAAGPGIVTVSGTGLLMDGTPWQVNGGSTNGNPHGDQTADGNMALALDLRVNTIRLTDFIPHPGTLGVDEYDATRWAGVDNMIALAAKNKLKVELDLATYRNFLESQSPTFNPYTYDWAPFLTFVANRTNTVTGKRYGSDPTIAFVSFAGETLPPANTESKTRGVTGPQLVSFYDKVMTTWGGLAPGQIRIPGGLFHLTDPTMPWREIFALNSCDLPATHSYSASDEGMQPQVDAYVKSLGKPWYLEEFGFGASHYSSDGARAADFTRQYDLALHNGAAGVSWWNINPGALNPTTAPLTADAIRARDTGIAAKR